MTDLYQKLLHEVVSVFSFGRALVTFYGVKFSTLSMVYLHQLIQDMVL